ncbi:hypothetical protein AeMF1_016139 [Aphanomyces euteiches]|nr:hypothetical protein AeMF1_016139 [Aphanomyces euteiches]KAH9191328.1 hypothetical protein AeNC1_006696 [Aphanomyces euteiches]
MATTSAAAATCFFNGCDAPVAIGSIKCVRHKRKGICAVQACRNQVNKRGVCVGHGARDLCTVEGCMSLGRSAGLCSKHSKEFGRPCAVVGCRRPVKEDRLCRHHLARHKYDSQVSQGFEDAFLAATIDDPTCSSGEFDYSTMIEWCSMLSFTLPSTDALNGIMDEAGTVVADLFMDIDITMEGESPQVRVGNECIEHGSINLTDFASFPELDMTFEFQEDDKPASAWLKWCQDKPNRPILLKDFCTFVGVEEQPGELASDVSSMDVTCDFAFVPVEDDMMLLP